MVKKDVGIGVIGIGMGANLLYVNREPNSRLEVRALCSPTEARVKRLAEQWGVPAWTTDYRALVARDDIQVVGVFSPDHLHAGHARAALQAGKHVVCTKPMCTKVDDAAELVRLVDKTGRKFIVGQTMRFDPEFSGAKRLYDDGDLGEILFAEAHYVHDARTFFPSSPWRAQSPQDLMYGGASHPIDLLRWFLGDVDEVQAFGRKSGLIEGYPYEDDYLINLRFKNGAIARVLAAYGLVHPPMPMMGLGLYGTKASLQADFTDQEAGHLKVVQQRLEEHPVAEMVFPPEREGALGHAGGVLRYLAHFEDCLLNDKSPSPGVRDGARTVAACSAAWESIRKGGVVKVRNDF